MRVLVAERVDSTGRHCPIRTREVQGAGMVDPDGHGGPRSNEGSTRDRPAEGRGLRGQQEPDLSGAFRPALSGIQRQAEPREMAPRRGSHGSHGHLRQVHANHLARWHLGGGGFLSKGNGEELRPGATRQALRQGGSRQSEKLSRGSDWARWLRCLSRLSEWSDCSPPDSGSNESSGYSPSHLQLCRLGLTSSIDRLHPKWRRTHQRQPALMSAALNKNHRDSAFGAGGRTPTYQWPVWQRIALRRPLRVFLRLLLSDFR